MIIFFKVGLNGEDLVHAQKLVVLVRKEGTGSVKGTRAVTHNKLKRDLAYLNNASNEKKIN